MSKDSQTFLQIVIISLHLLRSVFGDKWCVVSDEEAQKCSTMASAFGAHSLTPRIECVQATSKRNCMQMVNEGSADIVTVSSLEVGLATQKFDLEGILAENYAATTFSVLPLDYYAIALSWANQNWTVDTLRGSRSCHSSISEPAGWSLPLSVLLNQNIMTPLDCTSPLVSAANFFSQSCVPGAFSAEANPGQLNVSNLCDLCVGQEGSFCEANSGELCYGEPGAFRCLTGFSRSKTEARADVAFLRHETVLKMTVTQEQLDKAVSRLERFRLSNKRLRSDFVLLCPDGSRDVVENYHKCNYGKVPSSLVMVNSANSKSKKQEIVNMLLTGQQLFGDDFKNYFKMFDSKQLGLGQEDLIFSDKTVNLSVITPKEAKEWTKKLDTQLKNQFKCPLGDIRWCVFSFAELEKCSHLDKSILVQTYFWSFRLRCVMRPNINSCFEAIANGEADLISSEPGHAYKALYSHDLQVLSVVQNSDPNNEDYVIVLAKRNSDQSLFKFHDGAMPKVCLPWIDSAPYAFFMDFLNKTKGSHHPNVQSCDELTLLSPHLKHACVPGLSEGPRNRTRRKYADRFCSLCSSPSEPCEANNDHIFFGSTGAFRCMNENYPEIAVTSARVLMDNTNMHTYNEWNWNLRRSLFHLLCPYFGMYFSDPHYFKQCHLGSLPPYVILTRANISDQVRSVFYHFVKSLESTFTEKGWEKKPWLKSVFRGNLRADLLFPEIGRGFLPAEKGYKFQDYPDFVELMERRRLAEQLPFCNRKHTVHSSFIIIFITFTCVLKIMYVV